MADANKDSHVSGRPQNSLGWKPARDCRRVIPTLQCVLPDEWTPARSVRGKTYQGSTNTENSPSLLQTSPLPSNSNITEQICDEYPKQKKEVPQKKIIRQKPKKKNFKKNFPPLPSSLPEVSREKPDSDDDAQTDVLDVSTNYHELSDSETVVTTIEEPPLNTVQFGSCDTQFLIPMDPYHDDYNITPLLKEFYSDREFQIKSYSEVRHMMDFNWTSKGKIEQMPQFHEINENLPSNTTVLRPKKVMPLEAKVILNAEERCGTPFEKNRKGKRQLPDDVKEDLLILETLNISNEEYPARIPVDRTLRERQNYLKKVLDRRKDERGFILFAPQGMGKTTLSHDYPHNIIDYSRIPEKLKYLGSMYFMADRGNIVLTSRLINAIRGITIYIIPTFKRFLVNRIMRSNARVRHILTNYNDLLKCHPQIRIADDEYVNQPQVLKRILEKWKEMQQPKS